MSSYPIPTRRGSYCASINGHRPTPHDCDCAASAVPLAGEALTPTDAALIEEAWRTNHAQVQPATARAYYRLLVHYIGYLAGIGVTVLTATRDHVLGFMSHLESAGGSSPDPARQLCRWCDEKGYPDGRDGDGGWSPSRRKAYLAAIRFLYRHCLESGELPSVDPTRTIASPKVTVAHQFKPSREEVKAILEAPGEPRDRLLAYWSYYAPSRRETFRLARWRDFEGLDSDEAYWHIPKGKYGHADSFFLHPVLRSELRRYRRWQQSEAERNPRIAAALADERTAYVLLSSTGNRLHQSTLTKLIKWRAIRAGVAVYPSTDSDAVGGYSNRVTLHSMRRAWADHALNDPDNPVPLDVVAEVLGHRDVRTTRLHYARTKPRRATAALRARQL